MGATRLHIHRIEGLARCYEQTIALGPTEADIAADLWQAALAYTGPIGRKDVHITTRMLGLAGRVANRADGRVEAVAEGDEAEVAALTRWRHYGPPATRVDHVEVSDEPVYSALPESFTIR